jgi:hypothetical protein
MDHPSNALPDGRPIPEGQDFLQLCWDQEDDCQAGTDRRLPQLGIKAPQCFRELGTVLSVLDRLATCWWACRSGDHHEEYLVGRAATTARAALRLLRFGFYDQALTLTRHIGEVANLLCLFVADAASYTEWRTSDEATQRREFSPVRVRLRIEASGSVVPVDAERYALLSDIAGHVNSRTVPQAHNVLGIPVFGVFQEEGFITTLNELATATVFVLLYGTFLLVPDRARRKELLTAGMQLAEAIGGLTLAESRNRWSAIRGSEEFRSLVAEAFTAARRQQPRTGE